MKPSKSPKPKLPSHVYRIEDGCDTHWYASTSARQALTRWVKDMTWPHLSVAAYRKENPEMTIDVVQLPDREKMTVTMEDAPKGQGSCTQTARQWAKEVGEGCVASTCY